MPPKNFLFRNTLRARLPRGFEQSSFLPWLAVSLDQLNTLATDFRST